VARLLDLYLNSSETLIHNDLTAGNILVPEPQLLVPDPLTPTAEEHGSQGSTAYPLAPTASETHLIDWEFATYGPMSYDIGSLLGNLLLSYCATCGGASADRRRGTRLGTAPGSPLGSGGGGRAALGDGKVRSAVGQLGSEAAGSPAGMRRPLVAAAAEEEEDATWTSTSAPLLRCVVELWDELEARIQSYRPVRHDVDVGGSSCRGEDAAAPSAGRGELLSWQRVHSDR
jgi:hypothetical protein